MADMSRVYEFNYYYPEILFNPKDDKERKKLSNDTYAEVKKLYHRENKKDNWNNLPKGFEDVEPHIKQGKYD